MNRKKDHWTTLRRDPVRILIGIRPSFCLLVLLVGDEFQPGDVLAVEFPVKLRLRERTRSAGGITR